VQFTRPLTDQIAVLDVFQNVLELRRRPSHGDTLWAVWITAGSVQEFPSASRQRFHCGVVAGGVGLWNEAPRRGICLQYAGAHGTLKVVPYHKPLRRISTNAEGNLATAQATPQGKGANCISGGAGRRARLVRSRFSGTDPTDYATQEANQFLWLQSVDFAFMFALRAELELRAGAILRLTPE